MRYGNTLACVANLCVVTTDTWHHVAVVNDGTTYRFHLDGSEIGVRTDLYTFPNPTAPLTIGYAEPGHGYLGVIDEVVLYNRALSGEEIVQIATVAVPEASAGWCAALALGAFALLKRIKRWPDGRLTERTPDKTEGLLVMHAPINLDIRTKARRLPYWDVPRRPTDAQSPHGSRTPQGKPGTEANDR